MGVLKKVKGAAGAERGGRNRDESEEAMDALRKAEVLQRMGEEFKDNGQLEESKQCFLSAADHLDGYKSDAAYDLKFTCNMALATLGTIKKTGSPSRSATGFKILPAAIAASPATPYVEPRHAVKAWGGFADPPKTHMEASKIRRTGALPTFVIPSATASRSTSVASMPPTSRSPHGPPPNQNSPSAEQPCPSRLSSQAHGEPTSGRRSHGEGVAAPVGVDVAVNTVLAGAGGRSSLDKAKELEDVASLLGSGATSPGGGVGTGTHGGAGGAPDKGGVQMGVQRLRPTWSGPDVASQLLLNERLRDERRNPPARHPDASKPRIINVPDTKGSRNHRGDVNINDSAPSLTYKLRRFDLDTAKLQGQRGTTRGAAFRAALPPQARRTHALSPQQALAARLINGPE